MADASAIPVFLAGRNSFPRERIRAQTPALVRRYS
jgi:hypothetical protein